MFNLLGRVFGTEKALTATIEAVSNGIDALVYTDEEKANDAAADRSEARSLVVGWMQATQGQNLARRLISFAITAVWLLQYIISQTFLTIAVWTTIPDDLEAAALIMRSGANEMSSAVMLILGFYFAAPYMGTLTKAVTTKFTENVNK